MDSPSQIEYRSVIAEAEVICFQWSFMNTKNACWQPGILDGRVVYSSSNARSFLRLNIVINILSSLPLETHSFRRRVHGLDFTVMSFFLLRTVLRGRISHASTRWATINCVIRRTPRELKWIPSGLQPCIVLLSGKSRTLEAC